MTMRRIGILTAALATFFLAGEARAQKKLEVALYAPSAAFESSQQRFAYIQALAKAIEGKTGVPTEGKAYVNFGDLMKAKPDFAVIEGQCIAVRNVGELLAVASIDGRTSLRWAMFSRGTQSFSALSGKKVAYARTGCRDDDFIENAMLESEVSTKFFGGLVAKNDVVGAVIAVKDFKQADAVFAPADMGKGLNKLFDTGSVPTPGFVQLNRSVPSGVVSKVQSAVLSYGAGGGIDGWKPAQKQAYSSLSSQMRRKVKRPVFARPDVVRLDGGDFIVVPKSSFEQAAVAQHFWEPK